MPDVDVLFAFPDACLAYHCDSCDQRCCKTGSLAVFPAERVRLARRYPALELVSSGDDAGISTFATPRQGCWFLRGAACGLVEAERGRLRPLACSLFPFNLFAYRGATLVVAPNTLCPLAIEAPRGVTHAELTEALRRLGAAGTPPKPVRPQDPPDSAVLERVLRDAAGASLGACEPFELAAFTGLATETFLLAGARGLARLDLAPLDERVALLRQRWRLGAELLAIPEPGDPTVSTIQPLWAALLPSLRLFAFEAVPLAALADVSLLFALHLAHWQALAPARTLLPQTVSQMASSLWPTLALAAAWDTPWQGAAVPELGLAAGAIPRATVELPEAPLARALRLRALADLGARRSPP